MDPLLESLGISPNVFNYVILPLLIFVSRICDVAIATLRIIFVMNGKKFLAPLLGFFESLIWLVAIGQIFQNVENVYSYLAFAGGFSAGTLAGMLIEERLALGNVVVRVITKQEGGRLVDYFMQKKFYFTNIPGEGKFGPVNVLFTVIRRNQLEEVITIIKHFNPQAFYTVESVKKVSQLGLSRTQQSRILRFLHLKRR